MSDYIQIYISKLKGNELINPTMTLELAQVVWPINCRNSWILYLLDQDQVKDHCQKMQVHNY